MCSLTHCTYAISPKNKPATTRTALALDIEADPACPGSLNKDDMPYRVYVSQAEDQQVPAVLRINARGLLPGARVYWSVRFQPGPRKKNPVSPTCLFQETDASPFDPVELSSLASRNGVASVIFTTSTYAGDSFIFGADQKWIKRGLSRFQKARFKTPPVVVWKRISFEAPKVLKNIRYPQNTWEEIRTSLEDIHLELQGPSKPQIIDPAHPELRSFFYTHPDDSLRGSGHDPRYGPDKPQGEFLNIMLSEINEQYSDNDPRTINVIILGSLSLNSDLIRGSLTKRTPIPQPADYSHEYLPAEIDLREVSTHGMGMQMGGDSPSIYVWSDFWWMVSHILKVPHEKALRRVILHELGHHILETIPKDASDILDDSGHIIENRFVGKTLMSGFNSLQSREERRKEKLFITKPVWHPHVEWLIRKYFISLKQ